MQQCLHKVTAVTIQIANSLLQAKEDNVKPDFNTLISNAVESISLLGHVNFDLLNLHREQIRPVLKSEFAALCSTDIPLGPWLFGDDLARRLCEAKETSRISEAFHGHGYRSEKQSHGHERPQNFNSPKGGKNNFLYWGQQIKYWKKPKQCYQGMKY